MKTRIAMIVVLASLAGCSSEIDQIKEGRLDAYPDFTVGQAFNNRDVCKQTTWESFEDERGRTIVEYRCDIVGVDTFYQKQAETQLNKLLREQEQGGAWNSLIREEQNKIERLEQKLEREIAGDSMFTDSTRQEIAEARKQLAEYIA